MRIQSIKRTDGPGGLEKLDHRDYRELWPELRMGAVSVIRPNALSGGVVPPAKIIRTPQPVASEVIVAIVDSGIPDGESGGPFSNVARAPAANSAVSNNRNRDDDGHATDLAATIRGADKDSAPKLLFVKPFSAQGWPKPDRGAEEIRRAAKQRSRVIVLAWDTGHTTDKLRQAIRDVREQAVVVIAAGNWSLDIDLHRNWPASYGREEDMDHVITVMATDEHDERASYSNYGAKSVYIAAPGTAILKPEESVSPLRIVGSLRDSHRSFRGTSAATAHVARLAALVLAKNPTWLPRDVKKYIGATARDVTTLKKYGAKGVEKLCATERIVDFAKALASK